MTNWKQRMASVMMAAAVFCAAPVPAFAASAGEGKSGWFQTLLDVPVLGDLVRLLTGNEETDEEAAAASPETATAETATPETANALQVTPETAWTPFTAGWMQGSVQAGVVYPLNAAAVLSEEETAEPTVSVQQWASVPLTAGTTLNSACREETNFGDLAADAAANAAASWLYQQEDSSVQALRGLPVVALIDGASLTENVAAGSTLTEAAACVDQSTALAMVQVTPGKLYEILTLGLEDMNDSTGDAYGGFWQVSGLRAVYQVSDDEPRFVEIWLNSAGNEEGIRLDAQDTQNTLLLVLPADLLERCGVNPDAGDYTDYLAQADLTLPGAIAALPQNVSADTLTAILARGGSVGRILPATASSYDAVVQLGADYANKQISFLLDGTARTAVTDAQGKLTITGLSAGSHTFCMAAGEPAYYLSNLTFVGTADPGATAVTVTNVPAACVQEVPASPTPSPSASAATPSPAASVPTPQVVTVTSPDDPAPTATPTPSPAATPVPTPTATKKPTAAPVQDPTAGLLDTTPAPTLEPTPTPSPTPDPTPDPETMEKQEEMRQTSSLLPLYIGIAVILVGGVAAAVLALRSRGREGGRTYRRRRK